MEQSRADGLRFGGGSELRREGYTRLGGRNWEGGADAELRDPQPRPRLRQDGGASGAVLTPNGMTSHDILPSWA